MQPIQLFDGRQLFINAPQYHWHVRDGTWALPIGQEARERIVSLADLLEKFGKRTKDREEGLWGRTECMATVTQVVEHYEHLERRVL